MLTADGLTRKFSAPKFNTIVPSLCALYICVWSVFPAIQLGNLFRLAALGSAVIWFFFINSKRNYLMDRKDVLMALFVIFVVLESVIGTMGVGGIMSHIATFTLFIGYYMAKHYEKSESPLTFISVAVIAVLIFSNFKTFYALATDEHVTRAIVRNDEDTYSYIRQGVGGYGLIYPQVCIAPLFISWTLSAFKKNKIFFAMGVAWFISYVLMVFNSGYTIAVVVTVIGIILVLAKNQRSAIYSALIAVLVVVAIYFLILHSSGFKNYLLELFNGTTITTKINDIYNSYWFHTEADSVEVRLDAYTASLRGMLTYPILGGFWNSIGGGHSAILDTISKYGWFGGYAFITMIFYSPTAMKKSGDGVTIRKISNATIVTTFIIAILNTFPYQITLAVTLISLALFKDVKKWREQT